MQGSKKIKFCCLPEFLLLFQGLSQPQVQGEPRTESRAQKVVPVLWLWGQRELSPIPLGKKGKEPQNVHLENPEVLRWREKSEELCAGGSAATGGHIQSSILSRGRGTMENHSLSSLINQICSLLVKFLSAPKPSEGRSCCSSSWRMAGKS